MPEEKLNLYQKLAKIRKMTEVISKNKSGFNYKYTSVDEILARVTAGMNKYNVSLIPHMVEDSGRATPHHFEKTKFSKNGAQYLEPNFEIIATASMVYTWVDDDDPYSRIDVPWFIAGSQADPSQALGSGLTYGLRQFLLQFFQIASLDDADPDAWRSKQKEAENHEQKMIAQAILEEVNAFVNEYLETHADDKPKIQTLVKKYAKSNGKPTANYYMIEDPAVASELLSALRTEFSDKKEE